MADRKNNLTKTMQTEFIRGKSVLITGATAGIGKEVAIALAEMGAQVMIVARNMQKGITSQREIQMKSGKGRVELYHADLSSLRSVSEFIEQFKKRHTKLDVLINNAGTMQFSRRDSEDGFELTFAVNQLAPYLLTRELLPLLQASDKGRIVNVASDAHYKGRITDFDFLIDPNEYKGLFAYQTSKLCNVLTSNAFARNHPELTVNAMHPGVVATDIVRGLPTALQILWKTFTISPKRSSAFVLRLAANPELPTGTYFDRMKTKECSAHARNRELADRLLAKCDEWIAQVLQPAGKSRQASVRSKPKTGFSSK